MVNLPAGSRVNDAIQAAGGFTTEADASLLNLARYLQDGEHILVPSVNSPSAPDSDRSGIIPLSNQVDINSATLEQLDTLPEIGPITAQQIIDYRLNHGPFSSIEDIMKVSGIGQGIFDKIKDLITTVPVSP
jgi:competence protein ComEA